MGRFSQCPKFSSPTNGVPGGPGGGNGAQGGPPAGFTPPAGMAPPGAAGAAAGGTGAAGGFPGMRGGVGGPGGGGGMFGADGRSLAPAVTYAKAHGGGTIGVSSQSGAAQQIINSGADVAGLGGFSGRESEVTTAWLASAVADGRLRWVLSAGSGGGMMPDGRVGSTKAMTAVAKACTKVPSARWSSATGTAATTSAATGTGSSSTTVLYDCAGKSAAITAAGS